jgi:hypothetical protein
MRLKDPIVSRVRKVAQSLTGCFDQILGDHSSKAKYHGRRRGYLYEENLNQPDEQKVFLSFRA